MTADANRGPLAGLRVIQMSAIGPAPFASMMLTDLGADVIAVERVVKDKSAKMLGNDGRGTRSVGINVKDPRGVELVLDLVGSADVLIEAFRPGVMESLGLGPDVCLKRNPKLVYTRVTGWGQEGPYSNIAGHDLNYIAVSGALAAIGPRGGLPSIPLSLIGDFGSGAMLTAFGTVCAVLHARETGQGQVVDAAMLDGVQLFMSSTYDFFARGHWSLERGTNLVDGGAPFYNVYECSDGNCVVVGAMEPQFYAGLVKMLGLNQADLPPQMDPNSWPAVHDTFERIFKTKTRDEWTALAETAGDVCLSPLLTMAEAPTHPHNVARQGFVEVDGIPQAAPAPRFSATPGSVKGGPPKKGEQTVEILTQVLGLSASEVDDLVDREIVG